ncbi:MAG: Autotransporter adhesin SadA [Acinetobacter bereziniae]|uniref:Autotransporter adhesin SadA n=1 Tax=Acinetobacter bereziniae TaxID=106648 RepID=A0A833PKX4_ACIBZ|nr:MAG: Autotransporter adhesin SadA [Acinetobacter bereziniae]
MNKFFKVILCKSTGQLVVASENTKSRGKSTVKSNIVKLLSITAVTFSACAMSNIASAANTQCYKYSPQEGGNDWFNPELSFKCLDDVLSGQIKNLQDTTISLGNEIGGSGTPVDISGKADTTYVNSENSTQNQVIEQNKTDSENRDAALGGRIDNTNAAVTQNKADQLVKDTSQDNQIAQNKTDSENRDAALGGRIDNTNATVTQNKADQLVKDTSQDDLIAKNNSDSLDRDKGLKDNIDQNKADQLVKDTSQDDLIAKNNSDSLDRDKGLKDNIDQNKADQLVKDTSQDSEIKRLDDTKANITYVQNLGSNVLKEANSYTDYRVNSLEKEFRKESSELKAGIAGAMAMASMPQATTGGKGMFTLGGASYRGETAIAVGGSLAFESGFILKMGATTDSKNNTGASLGFGYEF